MPANSACYTISVSFSEQLLMNAIKQQSPELESRFKELLRQREELQEKQFNLQNQLLEDLVNASGDILQNKNLMESLNETKASSVAICLALTESESLQQTLQLEYNVYKSISLFASSLYFAIKEFSKVNVLYSLSVQAYIRIFLKCIFEIEDIDCNNFLLKKKLIQAVYTHMCRTIFKMDRVKFALHLCQKILPSQIPEDEWNFFLGHSFLNQSNLDINENMPQWMSDNLKQKCIPLQYNLPNLYTKLQLDKEIPWKQFLKVHDCEVNFPSHCDLSEFQKVITVQLLRSDRLYSAMNQCGLHLTALQNLNPEIIQLPKIYKETIASEPILFVTTPGTDPSIEIRDFAYIQIGKENYNEIAMGEGQESKAVDALFDAVKKGQWLVLKNLHLVTSWLPILSQNIKIIQPHDKFRLWLISEPHRLFSSVLADCCLKIAYEIPVGVKNNLLRSYSAWGCEYIQKMNSNGARVFFVLACIHALLQERRTYIPQGWSKFYEFNDSDFSTAIHLTAHMWRTYDSQIQWNFIKGICLDSVYGGRIENFQDLGILDSYLSQYLTNESLNHLWKPFQLRVSLPTHPIFQDYLNVINHLSDKNLPHYFGFPENIQKAWERTVSSDVISDLRKLRLNKNLSHNLNQDEMITKLTPFVFMWKKLNQGHDFIRAPTPTLISHTSVLKNFVSEEYCFAIVLLKNIHKSFFILNKIIKHKIVAVRNHLQLIHELIAYQTPKAWQSLWKGSNDPTVYLKSVIHKTIEISKWNNNSELFLKTPIDLSSLFRTETFIINFKENFAQKYQHALDDLVLRSNWKQMQHTDAITVTNFFVEGAIVEGGTLLDCPSNSDSVNSAPDCHLYWLHKNENNDCNENSINIPLYNSKHRDHIITYMQVANSRQEMNKWTQAGVAFFINY